MPLAPVLFILGLSGSGKSTFASRAAAQRNWLHLEIDRYPARNGIDLLGLRPQWSAFEAGMPDGFVAEVGNRASRSGMSTAIVSFPSMVMFPIATIKRAASVGAQVVLLYGSKTDCIAAFRKRESESGRALGEAHWNANNAYYGNLASKVYDPYRVVAFANGVHRSTSDLLEELERRFGRQGASEDGIELVAPDAAWAKQFDAEAAVLRSAVPPAGELRIEHFGSTAVPGIQAKPVIDIMLIHPDPALWPNLVGALTPLGYVYWAENPRNDRMFFVKGMPPFGERRTHHVHVRLPADAVAELAFRDLLRGDPAIAREYERLKEQLAAKYPNDRDAYTEGKTGFVAKALEAAGKRDQIRR